MELDFQNAIVFGVSALMVSILAFSGILLCGKHIITLYVTIIPLILILFCNYYKLKLIEKYKVIEFSKAFIIDNMFIIIAGIILFYFSDSNILNLTASEKHITVNIFVLIPTLSLLIPMIKTNKKIGYKLDEIKKITLNISK